MVKKHSRSKPKKQKQDKKMDKKGKKGKKGVEKPDSKYEKLDLKNFRDISTHPDEYRLRFYTPITGTEYEKQVEENTGKVTYKIVRKLKDDKKE